MDFTDQIRRYFGTDDLARLSGPAIAAGVERLQVDLGLERDPARRFALWTLLYTLDAAPDLDSAFERSADRDAARAWMDMADTLGLPDAEGVVQR